MNRRVFVMSTVAGAVEDSRVSTIFGQTKTMEPDLAALAGGKGLTVFNRGVTAVSDGGRKGIHLDEHAGDGVGVVVASPKVSVFVGDAKEPSLVVSQLSDRRKGWVGPWVGNSSAGDFANFRIVPA